MTERRDMLHSSGGSSSARFLRSESQGVSLSSEAPRVGLSRNVRRVSLAEAGFDTRKLRDERASMDKSPVESAFTPAEQRTLRKLSPLERERIVRKRLKAIAATGAAMAASAATYEAQANDPDADSVGGYLGRKAEGAALRPGKRAASAAIKRIKEARPAAAATAEQAASAESAQAAASFAPAASSATACAEQAAGAVEASATGVHSASAARSALASADTMTEGAVARAASASARRAGSTKASALAGERTAAGASGMRRYGMKGSFGEGALSSAAAKESRAELARAGLRRASVTRGALAYRASATGASTSAAATQTATTAGRVAARVRRAFRMILPSASGVGLAGAIIAPIIGLLLVVLIIAPIVEESSSDWNLDGLNENERAIALYFKDKGLDKLHIAAIMGHLKQESGCDPTAEQNPGGAGGIGLAQWGHLVDGGRGDHMATWAAASGKEWSDLYVQLDWLWAEMTDTGPAQYQTEWYSVASSAVKFPQFLEIDALDEAVEFYARWIGGAGDWQFERRIQYAREYLAVFDAGTGSGEGVDAVLAEAFRLLGAPYVFGAAGPDAFDCSGFVKWCFESAGYDLHGARTADQLYNASVHISAADAQPGDIVAFTYGSPQLGESMGHIGIYLGDGMMIHTASPAYGVQVSPVGTGYYGRFA